MKFKRSGATINSVIRTWGLSVAAYFRVNESDKYGSNKRCLPCHCTKKPLCPSHQREKSLLNSARVKAMSARNCSSLTNGEIILLQCSLRARTRHLPQTHFPLHLLDARNHILELLLRRPTRCLAKPAIRG